MGMAAILKVKLNVYSWWIFINKCVSLLFLYFRLTLSHSTRCASTICAVWRLKPRGRRRSVKPTRPTWARDPSSPSQCHPIAVSWINKLISIWGGGWGSSKSLNPIRLTWARDQSSKSQCHLIAVSSRNKLMYLGRRLTKAWGNRGTLTALPCTTEHYTSWPPLTFVGL